MNWSAAFKALFASPVDPTPEAKPAKTFQVSAEDVALARQKTAPREKDNPFVLRDPPPGVIPKGSPNMAMDDGINGFNAWAGTQWNGGAFTEGLQWLGYTYLSELAQRPEYRRISEVIATEMTRKWIKVTAKGDDDKTDEISKLNDALDRLHVRDAFRECAEQDGFFGRSHLFLDFGDIDNPAELKTPIGDGWNDISQAKIGRGSLKRIKTIEPVWTYPTNYNSVDPLKPDWYKPNEWFVLGKQVHASRLLTFIGREVPDMLKPAYSFGGLSMSQMAKPYVDNWLSTRSEVNSIIKGFSVFVLKTNMQATTQAGGAGMFARADLFNMMRDNRALMMLDQATEDFENIAVPLSSLDALQAQAQEHMAAVSGIPLIKLLGISPMGLNASSEGELKVFYDWIASYQESLFRHNLHRLLGFIQLSEFGYVDPDITFSFEPLWSLNEKELAEVRKTEAETDQIMLDTGVLAPIEVRTRVAADVDSPYASLDVDDMPDLLREEETGLEPEGGRPDPVAEQTAGIDPAGKKVDDALDALFPALDAEWEESKHTRAENGEFGSGGTAVKANFGTNKSKNVAEALRAIKEAGFQAAEWKNPKSPSAAVFSNGAIHINSSHKYWANPVANQKVQAESGHLSSDDPAHIINHEIGHALYDPPDNFFGGPSGPHGLVAKDVSKYAGRNPKEFVSEVHAGMAAGKTYPEETMRLFNQYAKPREGIPL